MLPVTLPGMLPGVALVFVASSKTGSASADLTETVSAGLASGSHCGALAIGTGAASAGLVFGFLVDETGLVADVSAGSLLIDRKSTRLNSSHLGISDAV